MTGLLVRVLCAIVAGFLFSQSAEFTQQYLQRLGGAVDALRDVVARFDAGAAAEGLSRQAAVERLAGAEDSLVRRQGRDAAQTAADFERLDAQYRRLVGSAPLLRPFMVLSEADWPVARRAFDDYRPAVPATIDGLVLALTGFAGGWALGSGAAGSAAALRRRRRKAAAKAP